MTKTLTINISGFVFHINDDAYLALKEYLDKISQHYKLEESGHEIIADIEQRIAELFKEKIEGENEVVDLALVQNVMQIMGMPEDFLFDNEEPGTDNKTENQSHSSNSYTKKTSKLYRDPESRVIGGVCSGLSHYLNIDKILLRIIFLILLLFPYASGPIFLVYVILWIAVPKAKTTAQRIEMKGENVNIGNIQKTVKEEKNERKSTYNSNASNHNQSLYRERKRYDSQESSSDAANVLMKIFGVVLFIIGFLGMLGLVVGLFTTGKILGVMPYWINSGDFLFFDHFLPGHLSSSLIVAALLIAGMPLLLIIYAGTKLIFRYESNNKSILFSALGLWLIGFVIAFSSAFGAVDAFSSKASVPEKIEFARELPDTLFVVVDKEKFGSVNRLNIKTNGRQIMITEDGEEMVGRPKFSIEKTLENESHIKLKKQSLGKNYSQAKENAEQINYAFLIKENRLMLDPYFTIDDDGQWRQQELDVTLRIPEGMIVFLDDTTLPIIHDIKNVSNTWDGDMTGKYWQMKEEGLTMINQ